MLKGLLVAAGLALAATGAAAELAEGHDYTNLPVAQPTQAKNKVEVTEFFWYGCPHCYALEPVISRWMKSLPGDVAFRRVPADFGRWTPGARLYYALAAIGEENHLHAELFDAIHAEGLNYTSEAALADWLEKRGVARRKFLDAYNSPAVRESTRRAKEITQAHGLKAVPSVVVDGRYLSSTSMAGGPEELPGVIDQLIAKVRAQRKAK